MDNTNKTLAKEFPTECQGTNHSILSEAWKIHIKGLMLKLLGQDDSQTRSIQ